MSDDPAVDDLVATVLLAAADHSAEQLAEALHRVVTGTSEVWDAFNRVVDRHVAERLRPGLLRLSAEDKRRVN